MKIKKLDEIKKIVIQRKKNKKKIVLCHGDFDNFHYGHLKYFESAKKFGNILIVSLTSDKYINKGLNRPIFNEKQRAEIISSLEIVDYVYIDYNLTAEKIISNLKPDYFVKGSDYKDPKKDLSGNIIKERKLVEKNGGKLVFTDEEVFSSSKIINHFGMNKDLLKSLINIKKKYDINEIVKKINLISKLKILIIGETIIDEYIYVSPLGKPSKEDILASLYNSKKKFLGGLFASVNILSRFTNNIDFITVVNKDKKEFDFVKKNLPKNLNKKMFFFDKRPTTTKSRFVQDNYFKVKKIYEYYKMEDHPISKAIESSILKKLNQNIRKYDLIIVNDYGHGLMTNRIISKLQTSKKFLSVTSQINAGNQGFNLITKYKKANYYCLDRSEALKALENKFLKDHEIAKKLQKKTGGDHICVTMGTRGSYMANKNGQNFKFPSLTNNVADTISAGDAFLCMSAPIMHITKSLELSSLIGNLAGALEVSLPGSSQSFSKDQYISNLNTLLKI